MGRPAAEYLAEALHVYGATHVFFVEAILRRTLMHLEKHGVHRILAHSEKAAAYMADGYARASGKVGVCMAQSVGAANLAAGLQDAYLNRTPVVAFTGHKAIPQLHQNAYQEIEHAGLFQSVTQFSAKVEAADQLPLLLRQAFREATGPTPRPAHLDLAGMAAQIVEDGELDCPVQVDSRHARAPAYRAAPDPADVGAAAEAINAAARPVAILGGGATLAGAGAEARALAARGIPVAYSLDGKGLVADDDDGTIGAVGNYSAPYANRIIHEADLVIYVGCDTSDMSTGYWRVPEPGTPIVHIDADSAELGRSYPGTLGIYGDAHLALGALVERLQERTDRSWTAHGSELRRAWRAEVEPRSSALTKPIAVERLCRELTRILPENAMLVADTGYSAVWTGTLVDLNHESQGFMRAAGSLGWAFPAAIGAQCALPDRPVVCFCGDGGFYYHLSELETARRWRIPVTVIINNNSAFGQDIEGVRKIYGGDNGRARDLTHFEPVSFAAVAESFGCRGIRVEDPADIADAIKTAIASSEPTVVDVVTDAELRAPAAWVPDRR